MFDETALGTLAARLSDADGIAVEALRDLLNDHFGQERLPQDLQAYREGKRPWKKLVDEVVPVAEFLIRSGVTGVVRFPLDNQPPDAWFRKTEDESWESIEVTRALARAKFDIARDLREQPMGRGFLGLADDAKSAEYDSARKTGRITASASGVRRDIEAAIKVRIEEKVDPKYAGHTLLVAAPLGSGGRHDWNPMRLRLTETARRTAFRRVVILDDVRGAVTPVLVIDVTDDDTRS